MRYSLPKRAGDKPIAAFILKACPRCLGDLVFHRDLDGDYYACLQCSVRIEPQPEVGQTFRAGRTDTPALL